MEQESVDEPKNPPKVIGIVGGGILTLYGVGIFIVGVGIFPEDPPGGAFVMGAGSLLAAFGIEITYQSLGDLRPSNWPEWLIVDFKILKRSR